MSRQGTTGQALLAALRGQRAFGALDPETLAGIASVMHVKAFSADDLQDDIDGLYLIIRGEVQLINADRRTEVALRPGELFGYGTPASAAGAWSARVSEDALLARVASTDVDALCAAQPSLQCFIAPEPTVVADAHQAQPGLNLLPTSVRALIKRSPITLPPDTSIRDAAKLMSEQRVSSVLIVSQGRLSGVVTDRDLRNRVIAQGTDTSRPLSDIATPQPLTMDVRDPAFEALLLMTRHNIHHVPITDGDALVGVITATDLNVHHSTSPVFLAGEIYKQQTLEGLAAAAARVGLLQQNLAASGASAYSSGRMITAITDAITCRLLQLAEAKLGPPPIDYVWVAAGSQARSEQTARSDQDNCMVIDDAFDRARHGEYFNALSGFVCDGLAACGYLHCPGEMMAMTDLWRQPKSRWLHYFRKWTDQPEPRALMLTCVFFDLRAIYGKASLLDELRREMLSMTQGKRMFLAHMVGNALTHTPPLGLFRAISTIRSGEHRGTIDFKHSGIVPVVDLARVYALAGGHEAINTFDRLDVAATGGEISGQSARDLRETLEFIARIRIRHQACQIAAGQKADNFVKPDELSNFERSQLKDAFGVVQTLQSVLGQRYQAGRF
ncbi:CBS domain protein [Methyloversatilis sp. RAC08]|uniref:putative nucleotidyltransferase substrate binding domain-containing protein n=1 Tax=Methyloversatilis sp. RAC08 TaxID=1842540 RepID=UPI0008578EE9|nr:putative nucleotidyltransferase substrate binding domain-containing protein [Methyloversatilis sp. RAC08]AOF82487.1 CBS domain protein [Methyloversatilis sp. RAC08]